MHTYEVTRPAAPGARLLEAVALLVVVAGVMAAAYRPFRTIPVYVDGRKAPAIWGATVGDVAASGLSAATPGDLLAADDRSVIGAGGGTPVTAMRNGRGVTFASRVFPGDRIRFDAGDDVVEATFTTETVTEPRVVEIGSGPIAEVLDEGDPGRALVTIGEVSGREVSRTVVTEARPARVVRSGGSGGLRVVALTFDDGPWPGQTERVLSILKKYDVKATFFMLGANADKYRPLARRVAAEGHQIGNHTWSHRTDAGTPWKVSMNEISGAQAAITRATGVKPRWFRPPKGLLGPSMAQVAKAQHLRIARWTVDPWDWDRPGVVPIVQRTVRAVRPGSVVLLHDGGGDRTQTITALEPVIRDLRRKGYTFVTLDELAEIQSAR